MRSRLSYSNVVATLALFVALGGASYAATTLAPNSVGTAQLRRGAVSASKLAFPLGIATSEAAKPIALGAGFCPPQDPCPPPFPKTLTATSLALSKPSEVLLVGSGEFNLAVVGGAAAIVDLGLQATTRSQGLEGVGDDVQEVTSTSATTLSVERVVSSPAGRHTFGLTATAGGVNTSTQVSGSSFQLAAIVLPRAK